MRLLITLDFPPEKGGIQRYLDGIVRHTFTAKDLVFAGGNCKVEVTRPYPCEVRWFRCVLGKINRKYMLLKMVVPLVVVLLKKRGDVQVECGNLSAAILPYITAHFLDCPYSVYTHGTELIGLEKGGGRSLFFRAVLKKAQKVVVVGSYTRTLLEKCGYEGVFEVVVPRIELGEALPEKKVRAEVRLISVGRLVHHKGHDLLLKALGGFPDSVEWSLVIAGSGPQRGELIALREVLGLQSKVVFKEGVSDSELGALYRDSDLFVLCSRETQGGTEGFGIVLLEAMAHNVAVVASNAGGIPEVLGYGECGLLVEPGSVEALRGGLLKMVTDVSLRSRYVQKAARRLREQYVW